jgi:hypothetical protein
LINQGYRIVYSNTYAGTTNSADMNAVYNQCNSLSIICFGGAAVGSNTLLLVSCANCHTLLNSYTVLNQPRLVNNAYWYYTNSLSIGFSPSSSIAQTQCDTNSQADGLRLCWHLDLGVGGWRLGSILYLNGDTNYLKLIFLR